jgi:hypothetical protein
MIFLDNIKYVADKKNFIIKLYKNSQKKSEELINAE